MAYDIRVVISPRPSPFWFSVGGALPSGLAMADDLASVGLLRLEAMSPILLIIKLLNQIQFNFH